MLVVAAGKGELGDGEQVCFSLSLHGGNAGSRARAANPAIAQVRHTQPHSQHFSSTFPSNPLFQAPSGSAS